VCAAGLFITGDAIPPAILEGGIVLTGRRIACDQPAAEGAGSVSDAIEDLPRHTHPAVRPDQHTLSGTHLRPSTNPGIRYGNRTMRILTGQIFSQQAGDRITRSAPSGLTAVGSTNNLLSRVWPNRWLTAKALGTMGCDVQTTPTTAASQGATRYALNDTRGVAAARPSGPRPTLAAGPLVTLHSEISRPSTGLPVTNEAPQSDRLYTSALLSWPEDCGPSSQGLHWRCSDLDAR